MSQIKYLKSLLNILKIIHFIVMAIGNIISLNCTLKNYIKLAWCKKKKCLQKFNETSLTTWNSENFPLTSRKHFKNDQSKTLKNNRSLFKKTINETNGTIG